jgi:hypothetical protein
VLPVIWAKIEITVLIFLIYFANVLIRVDRNCSIYGSVYFYHFAYLKRALAGSVFDDKMV